MMYADLAPALRGLLLLLLQFIFWWNGYQLLQCYLRKNSGLQAVEMAVIMAADYLLMQVEMTSIHAMLTQKFNTVVPYARGDSPVFVHLLLTVVYLLATVLVMLQTRAARRNTLSPISLKEAMDALPTGICYYEENGKVLLKNHVMEEISREIYGASLLNGNLFFDADKPIVSLKDGRTYLMQRESVLFEGRHIYLLTAAEITLEYQESRRLEEQQERANKLSERIKAYRQQIKDTTIEEETLRAKVRIHDELGETLLAGKRFLKQNGDEAEAEKLLALLERNAVLLKNEQQEAVRNPYEQVMKTAANLEVKLNITGELPTHPALQKVFATALHECITNTLRHAGGDCIDMTIRRSPETIIAELTNNGAPPAGPIRETGGLAQLHRLAEEAGGSMEIFWTPEFRLRLKLPTEVNEYGL